MPRPKAGEVLIKTKACGKLWNMGSCQIEKLLKDFQLALVLLELLSCLVITVSTVLRAMMIYVRIFFAYNRSKGTLYDGETRLFLRNSGKPISMYSMGGLAEYCVVPAHG
ncbi:hypothetical protein OIU84_002741, partial [Salix udensis]